MSEFPAYAPLPALSLHGNLKRDEIHAAKIVDEWLQSFQQRLDKKDFGDFSSLFVEDSWWRDVIGLSMNITSINRPGSIAEYVAASTFGFGKLEAVRHGGLAATLVDIDGLIYIQAGYTFVSDLGSGEGVLQLANVGPSEWKAWIVSSVLQKLHGQDDLGNRRNEHAKRWPGNSSAADQANGLPNVPTEPDDLQVIIIGAGLCLHPRHCFCIGPFSSPHSRPRRFVRCCASQTPWVAVSARGPSCSSRRLVESEV